jgi:phosphoglycolate phosphatase-like HAD superfamily hydrolase
MPTMRLLLFDLDGTLLYANGAGRRAVNAALLKVLGREFDSSDVEFSGKTDPQCLHDSLIAAGLSEEEAAPLVDEAVRHYVEALPDAMPAEMVDALPGAHAIVEALARRAEEHGDVALGLLTGNTEETAYLKLSRIGLDTAFDLGAFGSDAADRNELPAIAAKRASERHGRTFAPEDVFVIGDTPRDVACARHFGARAVAVATGHYDRDQLGEHRPDLLLDSLEETDRLAEHLATGRFE